MSISTHAPESFGTYLGEINRTPLLTGSEERELAARVLAGDAEARDRFVRANLRLVVNIARQYAGRGLPLEDLVSEGNMGLLRAVEGFDPTMNTRFSTYASYWIKQGIKRGIVNTAKTVRVPAYMVELVTQWRRAARTLNGELDRAPTHDEIADRLGLSQRKRAMVQKAFRVPQAGAQSERCDDQWPIETALADARAQAPDAALSAADDLQQVLQLLDKMDPRGATVLRMRFGLNDEESRTLKEVGKHLGLTRERVRQIEVQALAELADGIRDA